MRLKKRLAYIIPLMMILMLLSACKVGVERYELSNYIGKSVASFEKKSGTKLIEQNSGVYLMKDVVQVMTIGKDVSAVTLLNNAGNYSVFGVKIGMTKAVVDTLLADTFGTEVAKTVDTEKNTVTYSYLKDEKELYISYKNDDEMVVELSYYKVDSSDNKEASLAPIDSGELVATIGKTKVYYNEAMVYLKSTQEKYEADYGNGIWKADIRGNGETFGNMIKNEVMNQITELKIIRAEAGKEGITLTEEELAEAAEYAKTHYEGLKQEDINKYFITEELLQQVYADNILANKLFETKTINVDTEVPDEDAKQITVQDIFVYSADVDLKGNKSDLNEEDKTTAYNKIQNLLSQAKDTKDFRSLAEANTEADTIEYTFGKGQGPKEYGDTFEQAALSLQTGQVSDIITTDTGWHIIYCVSDFNEDATTQVKENIIEERRNQMFSKLYSEWSKDYKVVINDEIWDSVGFETSSGDVK